MAKQLMAEQVGKMLEHSKLLIQPNPSRPRELPEDLSQKGQNLQFIVLVFFWGLSEEWRTNRPVCDT